jgi:hypothetical protein
MIKYNSKNYENFAQFAKSYQNRYQKANFNEVNFELTKDVNNLCKDDVKEEGVYKIKGYKFFMTRIFEQTYTEISANGNEKNGNSFQNMYPEHPNKKGERVIKINDSSQLKRTVGALCGENPSGIVCKGRKNKGFQSATPDNIGEQKEKLNAVLASLDILKEVADITDAIGQIRQAVRNVWATQLKELRQADAKASVLEKLSGLSASEIANLMKLIK